MKSSPWFDAIFEPAGLLILAAALVSGLLAAWWLCPVGVALWAFIFLRILFDPSLRLNKVISKRVGLTQRFQTPFNRVQKIQVQIYNTIFASPSGTRRSLHPLQTAVNQLMDLLFQQCTRMTPLENLRITSTPEASLNQNIEKINVQIETASDPVTRQNLEESRQSMQARLQQVIDIRQKLDRFDTQLIGLENDLQSILTETVKLQASHPQNANQEVRVLLEKVKNEIEQLRSFS